MSTFPDQNNVYGSFVSNKDLNILAEILKREITDSLTEITVRKSSYDGVQTLFIESDKIDFETRKLDNEGIYSLNGAVAGSEEEIKKSVGELYIILQRYKYSPEFEIYNSNYECIGEFNA